MSIEAIEPDITTPRGRRMRVINRICFKHGVLWCEVYDHDRSSKLTPVKREIIVFLRDEEGMSFPQIGAFMDRDHSTVMYNYRIEKKRLESVQS